MDRKSDFDAMDFDQLWLLYEDLTKVLAEKIAAEFLSVVEQVTGAVDKILDSDATGPE